MKRTTFIIVFVLFVFAGLVFGDSTGVASAESSTGIFSKISGWFTGAIATLGLATIASVVSYFSRKFNIAKYSVVAGKWLKLADVAISMFDDNTISKEELEAVKKAYYDALCKATNEKLNTKELDLANKELERAIGSRRSL